jgi:hypothetical protein
LLQVVYRGEGWAEGGLVQQPRRLGKAYKRDGLNRQCFTRGRALRSVGVKNPNFESGRSRSDMDGALELSGREELGWNTGGRYEQL